MKKMIIEMPLVKKCDVGNCGFNVKNKCHAKAITIGDSENPECDTFLNTSTHTTGTKQEAGVGACKVSTCIYNTDFECTAENITVGSSNKSIKCMTFKPRG